MHTAIVRPQTVDGPAIVRSSRGGVIPERGEQEQTARLVGRASLLNTVVVVIVRRGNQSGSGEGRMMETSSAHLVGQRTEDEGAGQIMKNAMDSACACASADHEMLRKAANALRYFLRVQEACSGTRCRYVV